MTDFYEALADDLNTAKALAVLQSLLTSSENSGIKLATVLKMDEVLGLGLKEYRKQALQIPTAAKDLLKQRILARQNKDYQQADNLRKDLQNLGVEVQDTSLGQQAINTKF
jgi:cysteinyl-tRNA synthetase